MKKCKDCAFCDTNLCRIDPPKMGFVKLGDASATDNQGVWPEVDPETDWCGKFKAKTVDWPIKPKEPIKRPIDPKI